MILGGQGEPPRSDIALAGRALREGWIDDETRRKVVDRLRELTDSTKERTALSACRELLRAAELDIKQESVDQKRHSGDDSTRLQLLELAQRIPVDELAQIASENGILPEAVGDG